MLTPHYHVGVAVPDIEAAMAGLGRSMGLSWARLQELTVAGHRIRLTYSIDGPPHLELIEGPAGSVWAAGEGRHHQHLGYWTGELRQDRARLEADGFRAVFETPGAVYLEAPTGVCVELVDERVRPALMRWLAGGDFR